jgi:hypothetical protein
MIRFECNGPRLMNAIEAKRILDLFVFRDVELFIDDNDCLRFGNVAIDLADCSWPVAVPADEFPRKQNHADRSAWRLSMILSKLKAMRVSWRFYALLLPCSKTRSPSWSWTWASNKTAPFPPIPLCGPSSSMVMWKSWWRQLRRDEPA